MLSPLFIFGLQRSGTTLLYEMLGASGAFTIGTAWHVICFDELRRGGIDPAASKEQLCARMTDAGLKSRGIDIVAISPDTPEEYGFVLDNLGLGSCITARNLPVFEQYCDVLWRYDGATGPLGNATRREGATAPANPMRCDGATGAPEGVSSGSQPLRPLLLKNTWGFANVGRIKALLPDARFIFIHRNPYLIVSSFSRAVRTAVLKGLPYLAMLSRNYARLRAGGLSLRVATHFCERRPRLVARGAIEFVARSARGWLRAQAALPASDRIDIRYEDLCTTPNEVMARLLAFANVTPPPRDYAGMIGAHAQHVEPEIRALRGLVKRRFAAYAAATGYDIAALDAQLDTAPRP